MEGRTNPPHPSADCKPAQITHLNDDLKPTWGKSESINWTNDNFNIQGWLLYPANYDPSKKYPIITYIHGGPSNATTPNWPPETFGAVPFSALGYFVFMPNPRGSYGQTEEFTQANVKDFGYGDLRDSLTGLDLIEKRFPIDRSREGITGWSYGGFMTMFAVTQTNRFHAAVAGAGISNWQSYYGQNSIDQWMVPFFGATVYDDPAIYARSSPINFIKNVTTPTLRCCRRPRWGVSGAAELRVLACATSRRGEDAAGDLFQRGTLISRSGASARCAGESAALV